jgi:predicted MFS family arabinose efflux permease
VRQGRPGRSRRRRRPHAAGARPDHRRHRGLTAPATTSSRRPAAPRGTSRGLVVLLAVGCGLSAANLYYAQPLLHTIARSFGTTSATAGLVVTLSQIGYAVGLALVLPLGDLLDRRRLVPAILLVTTAALAASAVAPSIGLLVALAGVVGVGSVAAQLLVPLAAELARPEERGSVVGTVMSGLLLGILLARTLSGLVAGSSSWHVVYWVATGLAGGLALVLSRALPDDGPRPALRYRALLAATVRLVATEPLLRRRAAYGALGFAAFSVFWTTVAFLLSGPPYRYGDGVIGMFGLVGVAGALCAGVAGRLADRGHARLTTLVFSGSILVSFLPLWLGRTSVAWLVVGILVLDVGVQGLQVTNQSLIYTLGTEGRSRITSAYMVCYFAGGALGSAAAGATWDAGGWTAVCWLGAALGGVATAGSLLDRRSRTRVAGC